MLSVYDEIYFGEKKGAEFLILPRCHWLLHKNCVRFINCKSVSLTVNITIIIWTIQSFKGLDILHVVSRFPLGIVNIGDILTNKFQSIPLLMPYTLIKDPVSNIYGIFWRLASTINQWDRNFSKADKNEMPLLQQKYKWLKTTACSITRCISFFFNIKSDTFWLKEIVKTYLKLF